ncbi:MAG: flagellar hook-basal body complex protein FliE [Acetobacteraceae bacterium]
MSLIPTIVVTPGAAARAYGQTASGAGPTGGTGGADFGATLQRAIGTAVGDGRAADQQAMGAIAGQGNLTDVVTAVTRAELALQTATAIRDKFVQAYQAVMQMPI